jgi:anti-sigma B factor antagonist
MKFSLNKQERYTVFRMDETNLNALVAPDLKSELVYLNNEGVQNLIFDVSPVEYVDSSGLSAILTANRLFSSNDQGCFVLTGIQHDAVKRLIEISRLNTVLPITPTVEEARDYIFMQELEREISKDPEE